MNFLSVAFCIHVALSYLAMTKSEIFKVLEFCIAYLSDIVYSKSEQEHLEHL